VEPGRLVDYLLGELTAEEETSLEEHFFECDTCASRLRSIESIGLSVADAVLHAAVGANVNGAFVDRVVRDGLTVREYRIPAGETVACSAGPEDLVVVRLAADFGDAENLQLQVTLHDLERDETSPVPARRIEADRDLGEVVLVFPGEVVRTYPRSRWTLSVSADAPSGSTRFGPFVMDHTP
jgi:hypothetical protein